MRFLDFKSGKPFKQMIVTVTFWNGDPIPIGHIPPGSVVRNTTTKTDKYGKAVLDVPEPIPEHLTVFQPDLVDSFSPDFSPAEVFASGTVAEFRHGKGQPRLQVSAKSGEIIILNRRLGLWDRIRQELP
jgi:hypothetical protein